MSMLVIGDTIIQSKYIESARIRREYNGVKQNLIIISMISKDCHFVYYGDEQEDIREMKEFFARIKLEMNLVDTSYR